MVPQSAASQGKTAQLRSAIKAHRDTWVTEADISFIASLGMNCVRLPVGYWVVAQTQVLFIIGIRCRMSACAFPTSHGHQQYPAAPHAYSVISCLQHSLYDCIVSPRTASTLIETLRL